MEQVSDGELIRRLRAEISHRAQPRRNMEPTELQLAWCAQARSVVRQLSGDAVNDNVRQRAREVLAEVEFLT